MFGSFQEWGRRVCPGPDPGDSAVVGGMLGMLTLRVCH